MTAPSRSGQGRAWARAIVAVLAAVVVAVLLAFPYDQDGDHLWPYIFSVIKSQAIGLQVFYGLLFVLGLLFPVIFAVELYAFRRPFGWKSRVFWLLQAGLAAFAVLGLHFAATFQVIYTEATRPQFGIFIVLSYAFCSWSLLFAVVPNRANGLIVYPLRERKETAAG